MTNRQRTTINYKEIDIIVEKDVESISGISFLIKDTSMPGNSFYAFAYYDEAKKFVNQMKRY